LDEIPGPQVKDDQEAQEHSYPIPVFSGLLRDGHYQRMGMAIWVFIWLLDKVTSEYTDEDGTRWGKVLGGQPVRYQDIATDLKICLRMAKYHVATLCKETYIRVKRHPRGIICEIRNSRKRIFRSTSRSATSCPSETSTEVQDPAPLKKPEVQGLATRSATSCTRNPVKASRTRVSSGDITRHNNKYYMLKCFERFWSEYPKKVGKKKAREKFIRLSLDEKKFKKIMEALRTQKESPQWKRDEGQYIPHPTTWINGDRWEDDLETLVDDEPMKDFLGQPLE